MQTSKDEGDDTDYDKEEEKDDTDNFSVVQFTESNITSRKFKGYEYRQFKKLIDA